MKDLYLERNMDPQVAILYATVADTFKRLQKLVEGTDEKELSFKG
ncbi:DinB family protein, partial [Bacillus sp. OA1]|nr:DinB family protein [Bacillus sp. OA1]